jgi:hypothetical protein
MRGHLAALLAHELAIRFSCHADEATERFGRDRVTPHQRHFGAD